MPSMSEILSVVSPSLPAGHPFTLGLSQTFWTATPYGNAGNVLIVGEDTIFQAAKNLSYRVWCVRGPGLELW